MNLIPEGYQPPNPKELYALKVKESAISELRACSGGSRDTTGYLITKKLYSLEKAGCLQESLFVSEVSSILLNKGLSKQQTDKVLRQGKKYSRPWVFSDNGKQPSTSKRTYSDFDDYCLEHNALPEDYKARGFEWFVEPSSRYGVQYPVKTGIKKRYLDGKEPEHCNPPGKTNCWYLLDEAIQKAGFGVPLCIVNGPPSVIAAQRFGIAATALIAGEKGTIDDELLAELKQLYTDEDIVIAFDCDKSGREASKKLAKFLNINGYKAKAVDLGLGDGCDIADFVGEHFDRSRDKLLECPEPSDEDWKFKTLKDALQPKPPKEYVVDGLIHLPSLSIFYGDPGSLKTMFCLNMGLCISAGTDFGKSETHEAIKTIKKGVLFIDADSGEDTIERRLYGLMKGLKISEDAPFHYISYPNPPFIAVSKNSVDDLSAKIKELKVEVVIIDCLLSISGETDENSARMYDVMAGLRRITEETKSAVIIIHHPPKSTEELRGHGSIKSSLDYAYYIEREKGENVITIKEKKSRHANVDPFAVEFVYISEDKELIEAKFVRVDVPEKGTDQEEKKEKQIDKAKRCIREAYFQEGGPKFNGESQSKIVEEMQNRFSLKRDPVLKVLNDLEEKKIVRTETGQKNAKLYYNNNGEIF